MIKILAGNLLDGVDLTIFKHRHFRIGIINLYEMQILRWERVLGIPVQIIFL